MERPASKGRSLWGLPRPDLPGTGPPWKELRQRRRPWRDPSRKAPPGGTDRATSCIFSVMHRKPPTSVACCNKGQLLPSAAYSLDEKSASDLPGPSHPVKPFGEAGPSGAPRRDLPRRGPPIFAYCIANTVRPGARVGEFLLGEDEFLEFADGRVSGTVRRGFSEVRQTAR